MRAYIHASYGKKGKGKGSISLDRGTIEAPDDMPYGAFSVFNTSFNVDVFYTLSLSNVSLRPFTGLGLGYQMRRGLKSVVTKSSAEKFHMPVNLGIELVLGRDHIEIVSRIPTIAINNINYNNTPYLRRTTEEQIYNIFIGYSHKF